MNTDAKRIVETLVAGLERAWNAADGTAFAQPFAEDADFVNIRGEHLRPRAVIAKGHQGIFNTIYKGSVVQYRVAAVRAIAPAVLLAHVKTRLMYPRVRLPANTARCSPRCWCRNATIGVSPRSTTH
jgi:uncharacterized protein (TIGR02246 family)